MTHKHDWVTGLLCEIERYCCRNKLDELGAAVSFAISAAIDEIENSQNDENIFYISDYVGRKTLRDTESVLRAFVEKVEDLL